MVNHEAVIVGGVERVGVLEFVGTGGASGGLSGVVRAGSGFGGLSGVVGGLHGFGGLVGIISGFGGLLGGLGRGFGSIYARLVVEGLF